MANIRIMWVRREEARSNAAMMFVLGLCWGFALCAMAVIFHKEAPRTEAPASQLQQQEPAP